MSSQPPPPGNQPPPPPGGWQQPPQPPPPPPGGFGGAPPPPGGFAGAPPPPGGFGGAQPPPPGYGPPGAAPDPGAPQPWGEAPPPPAKKSKKGLLIGLGLGLALLLILVVVGLASVANKVTGGTALADLSRGDCFNTSKALVADKATRVPCTEPHTDEVAGVITFPGGDNAPYPGQSGILEFGKTDCVQQVTEFYGNKEPSPTTQVFVFGPNEAAWENGERAVVCSLREESAVKRTGSYLD